MFYFSRCYVFMRCHFGFLRNAQLLQRILPKTRFFGLRESMRSDYNNCDVIALKLSNPVK